MIFYAYTGRIAFAPLRSQGFVWQDDGTDPSQLPMCSPKSMYRLAVKVSSAFPIETHISRSRLTMQINNSTTTKS